MGILNAEDKNSSEVHEKKVPSIQQHRIKIILHMTWISFSASPLTYKNVFHLSHEHIYPVMSTTAANGLKSCLEQLVFLCPVIPQLLHCASFLGLTGVSPLSGQVVLL
jgi:hypothetical protein